MLGVVLFLWLQKRSFILIAILDSIETLLNYNFSSLMAVQEYTDILPAQLHSSLLLSVFRQQA